MSVPSVHSTPKLESLPKGLRAKAEAIINKKFGLKTETVAKQQKKTIPEGVRGMGWDMSHVNYMPEPWEEIVRMTPEYRVKNVIFNPTHLMFEVIFMCYTCGMKEIKIVPMDAANNVGLQVRLVCRCGQGNAYVSQRDMRAAMESRF